MHVNSYCWAICEFAVMSHMWSQKHDITVTSLWCFHYDLTFVTCLWYHCDIVVISLLDWDRGTLFQWTCSTWCSVLSGQTALCNACVTPSLKKIGSSYNMRMTTSNGWSNSWSLIFQQNRFKLIHQKCSSTFARWKNWPSLMVFYIVM